MSSSSFSYQTSFYLNKVQLVECYEQSVNRETGIKAYLKAIVLLLIAAGLMASPQVTAYVSYFILVLAVLEAVGTFYHKPWWVYRQLLSRAANNKIELTIDETAISTKSPFGEPVFNWQSIEHLEKTEKGWLFISNGQQQYLSDSYLNDEVQTFLQHKQQEIKISAK